jgi:hypothetical protein
MDAIPLVGLVDGMAAAGFLTCFGYFASRVLRL